MSCPVYIISHAVRCLPCDDKQFISSLVLNLFNFTAFIESKLCIHVMSSLTTYFNDFSQCNLYLAVVLKDQRDHYTYQEIRKSHSPSLALYLRSVTLHLPLQIWKLQDIQLFNERVSACN